MLESRAAVVEYYRSHAAQVKVEDILLTASSSESYSYTFRLLADVGDEVLIAQPSYPLFDYLADLADVVLRPYRLFYDHGWWIDWAELEGAITNKTRAIVVVHPNNPTGHATTAKERERLREVCRRHGLSLIVDEVFLDYPAPGRAALRSFAAEPSDVLTFVLSGLSKVAGLPQMKVGWMVVSGEEEEREEAMQRLEIIADTFLSVNTPAQLALPAWLEYAPEVQAQIRARIAENLGLLREAGLQVLDFDGGWSAMVRVPRTFHERNAAAALQRVGVVTHPAEFYGLADAGLVVVSLIVPVEAMKQGLERTLEAISAGFEGT